jgi:catechol 2,3-dioxygenase-like lactoylglutathione lyase family enzyme
MSARLVGINHVALEVGDLDEALAFYGQVFELRLRGRIPGMAFIDAGDQFIALSEGRGQDPDPDRHFGLVVDIVPSRGLDFRDPWGNLVQVVDYRDIQFTKTPAVLRAMGLDGLRKTPAALDELREKGVEVAAG